MPVLRRRPAVPLSSEKSVEGGAEGPVQLARPGNRRDDRHPLQLTTVSPRSCSPTSSLTSYAVEHASGCSRSSVVWSGLTQLFWLAAVLAVSSCHHSPVISSCSAIRVFCQVGV